MLRSATRVFAVLLGLLLTVFSAGWWGLSRGPDNPIPWAFTSVWGDMIMVGMAVEQWLGVVPSDGRSLRHAAFVVGSAATVWALVLTVLLAGGVWCVRRARQRASAHR